MFSKKKITGLALAVAFGLSAVVTSGPAFAEDKLITVWVDETRGPNLERAIGTLAQQKVGEYVAGYKVKIVSFSNFDALKTAVDNATAKSGPDIIIGANDWVATGAKNGKLAPLALASSVKSNFSATALGDLSYKGKLYGVPLDINNVGMLYNTKLVSSAPKTFGEMVNYYNANKTSKKLKAGLCVAGGGMSFGAHPVLSALGGGAYQYKAGKLDAAGNPINVAAFSANIKKYLLGANGKTNGFFPAVDTGCADNFKAGKVPFAIIGNWEWKDYTAKGFSMSALTSVPGVTAGTYGASFGSVSGALLTSFAKTNGNESGAKTLLTKFFASRTGQLAYQRFEQRPPANKQAALQATAGQAAFSRVAAQASVPQLGSVLNGVSKSYWDSLPAFWTAVLVEGKDPTAESRKLNTILKKNLVAGAKNF
jgi:arabinogalactan oligomer/maltooligosaccharide transport system substrate-binding protein